MLGDLYLILNLTIFAIQNGGTVGENNIATLKIRNNYGTIQSFIFRYCDSSKKESIISILWIVAIIFSSTVTLIMVQKY